MNSSEARATAAGKWLALTAALLGWMFDGFEMGLFPVISRPALIDLLGFTGLDMKAAGRENLVGQWNSLAIAAFLIGAATGGVLFGWLGDRLGRVRSMSLSILTYALCSGLAGFAAAPWQIVAVRFIAALGMGGEWSLGVALVMEVWGGRSRSLLAGLIGAAANVGFLVVALLSLSVGSLSGQLHALGLNESWAKWRLLMVLGTLPALLTFVIILFVPESERWQAERGTGRTSAWNGRDLLGVLFGAAVCWGILLLWVPDFQCGWPLRIGGTLLGVPLVTLGFLFPTFRYLERSKNPDGTLPFLPSEMPVSLELQPETGIIPSPDKDKWPVDSRVTRGETRNPLENVARLAGHHNPEGITGHTLRTMLLAACLSGVPLMGTWASIQWAPTWANKLAEGTGFQNAKEWTQMCAGAGAVAGCLAGALLAGWKGRRLAYVVLCLTSLGSCWLFFREDQVYGAWFLCTAALAGACTAAFYGWLPLYLPELFPTRIRATGQGFGYNYGRILAAMGALQTSALMQGVFSGRYATACSLMSLIYVVGLAIIWLAPETGGQPLPE